MAFWPKPGAENITKSRASNAREKKPPSGARSHVKDNKITLASARIACFVKRYLDHVIPEEASFLYGATMAEYNALGELTRALGYTTSTNALQQILRSIHLARG